MSVWGHAGAGSAHVKVACNSTSHTLIWNLYDCLFQTRGLRCFCFSREDLRTIILASPRSRHAMETLDSAPEETPARSRSPSRSPEGAPQHPPTTPIHVTESEALVITPDVVSHGDVSCLGCLTPSRRLKHTCTKAKHTGKRHASPYVEARHAKRSGTGLAPALMAPEVFDMQGTSLASDRGIDMSVWTWETHIPSAPHDLSSSVAPPPPTRPPSPVLSPTFEQREPAELDVVVVMDECRGHTLTTSPETML